MPRPVISLMDGTAGFSAEAGVGFCVVEVKMVTSKVFKLIFGEAQFPGDVAPADGEGVVVFDNEGHGTVVK